MKQEFIITGMTCGNCKKGVEEEKKINQINKTKKHKLYTVTLRNPVAAKVHSYLKCTVVYMVGSII